MLPKDGAAALLLPPNDGAALLPPHTLGRFEEGADAAVLGDLEACTTAVRAARVFTLDEMDCKSGAAAVDGFTEATPAPVVVLVWPR